MRTLDAKNASIILVVFLAAGIISNILTFPFFSNGSASNGIQNSQLVRLMPAIIVLNYAFAGAVLIYVSLKLTPNSIKDTSPTGAAWVRGVGKGIISGLLIGVILGICNQCLAVAAHHTVPVKSLNHFNRMAFTPGLAQVSWIAILVVIAPPIEEMLFRGILYGGYRKSFGRTWAALSTTLLFVALHFPNYSHFLSNIIFVTITALATLWCRLHWSAIGPAIAVHFGYNAVVAFTTIYWST